MSLWAALVPLQLDGWAALVPVFEVAEIDYSRFSLNHSDRRELG